jgi:hypothetical protein
MVNSVLNLKNNLKEKMHQTKMLVILAQEKRTNKVLTVRVKFVTSLVYQSSRRILSINKTEWPISLLERWIS